MDNYDILLLTWFKSGLVFTAVNLISMYMLFFKDKYLSNNKVTDTSKLKKELTNVKQMVGMLPKWLGAPLLSQVIVVMSILDGLLWFIRPYRQMAKLYSTIEWNFKEIK